MTDAQRTAAGFSSSRPTLMGRTHAVSTGHYLATIAGYRILEQGGNAIDAGVAAGIALNVILPQDTSFGGVAPILIYSARDRRVSSISGLGRWPRGASLEHFVDRRSGRVPLGIERVVVPAAPDAWLTALMEHGTMGFAQVVQPALEYARDGIAVGAALAEAFTYYATQEIRLSRPGSRCGTTTKAIPGAGGVAPNSRPRASSPPADETTPTTGKSGPAGGGRVCVGLSHAAW